MLFNRSIIFLIITLLFHAVGIAQSVTAVRKQKEKTEKEISYLNKLLQDAAKNKNVSTEKLIILQEKIAQSKKLLNSLNQEVNYLQENISRNELRISELEAEKNSMLDLYSKLVYSTWKKRNKTDKLMFIFSSADFNQAYNRFKYFQQIQEYSGRQLELIHQVNDSLNMKNQDLKQLMGQKNIVLNTIHVKSKELESEKIKENSYVTELQKKEKELKRRLQKQIQDRERLAKQLNKLISQQIKKGKDSSSGSRLTPEEKLISDDFARNKGKLPWPVMEGFISKKFGLSTDPVHKLVKMFNYGVDITTSKNAQVRAVFSGVVTQIGFISGGNNVVVIQHGDYFTVYPNLIKVTVKQGDKVNTKDILGTVNYDSEEGSILNFQIWKITGKTEPDKLNPEQWLAK